ncbi:MAG: hypothetical protein IJE43_16720 [Alphaproteobacteria bacterium]|nr:hypothetical protein [Alphaproteobacteria bacterium]
MSDIIDIIKSIDEAKAIEEENKRKEEEKAKEKVAESLRRHAEQRRKWEEEEEKAKKAKKDLNRFESGQCSLDPKIYEDYLKAGYKPTPKSMHPTHSDKWLLDFFRATGGSIDSKNRIEKIASYYKGRSYEKVEHPCLVEIIELASKYGMPKKDFNDLLGYATSPEVLDALVKAGADIKQFPLKEMMHYYGLSTGKVLDSRVINRDYDTEEFPSPNYTVARNIRKTIKKVLEYGFDTNEVAKILADGSYDAKLLQGCLDEIKREEILIQKEIEFRKYQEKLAEEGKEKGVLSYDDRMKKLEDSSMSMYDKSDERIIVPFSILKGKGGIVLENTPETREKVEAYLSSHKLALKTSLHINALVRNLQKEGISAEVLSENALVETFGVDAKKLTVGKLDVKVPKDKIQKFIKLKEGDIYQTSSGRPTLARAPKGGVILTRDGNFDEMPKNMVVKEKTTSTVLQAEPSL